MLAERIAASDLAEMAAQGASLASGVRPDDLPRLAAILAREPGRTTAILQVRVGLRAGPEAVPIVRIEVHGTLPLVCQRCLAPVDWPLDIDVLLTAVTDDAGTTRLASPFDSVLLDEAGGLPLRAVVEDEILSVLPLAPLHAEQAQCQRLTPAKDRAGGTPERQANRPFAGLAGLLRPGDGDEGNK